MLENLIYLYDYNRITIDGSTDLAFSGDRARRFEAYGWFVQQIDGHNRDQIEAAYPFGWDRYLSTGGLMIGMEGFGQSAPSKALAERFGFTVEGVLKRIRETFC
jgi:transketolase